MKKRLVLYEPFAAAAWIIPELKGSAGDSAIYLETRALLGLPEITPEKIKAFGAAIGLEKKEDPRLWWETFREVDEASLETDEERDFFLSHLSEKTHARLNRFRAVYREHFGELVEAFERFKAGASLPDADEIVLVPRLSQPTQFLEKFRSFLEKAAPVPVRVGRLGGEEPARCRPLVLEGASSPIWERLARRARKALRHGKVGIAFQGGNADRFALKLALARQGLALREDWLPNEEAMVPNPWTAWRQIRESRQLPWPRRLGIERKFRDFEEARTTVTDVSESGLGVHLAQSGILETTELPRWQAAPPPLPSAEPRPEVFLLPPQFYPSVTGTTILYFVNPLCPPARTSSLGSWEKERLWDAGFPLPLPVSLSGEPGPSSRRSIWFRLASPVSVSSSLKLKPRADKCPGPSRVAEYRGEWDKKFTPPPTLSASGLDAFQECPAYYFFSRKLKLQTREPLWEQGALVYGSLAHATLDRWITGEKTPERAQAIFHELTAEKFPTLDEGHPLRLFLREQIETLSPNLPHMEAALTALFGDTQVLGREVIFELELEEARFTGRIDRVDQLPNGSLLVIDYKTGNVGFSPDHMADGRDHQSILYALAAEKIYEAPVGAFLYYDLKLREVRRGLVRKELLSKEGIKALTRGHAVDMEKWAALHGSALAHLRELVAAIHGGEWRPNPGSQCADCEFLAPCRRGQPWQS